MTTFTVSCPACGTCFRGVGILDAMAFLPAHPLSLLIDDDSYDRLVAETLTAAEEVVA